MIVYQMDPTLAGTFLAVRFASVRPIPTGGLSRRVVSESTEPIFTIFSKLVEGLISFVQFAIARGRLPWQPILKVKSVKLAYPPSFVVELAFQND